jgi:hypothetical protein
LTHALRNPDNITPFIRGGVTVGDKSPKNTSKANKQKATKKAAQAKKSEPAAK